MQDWKRTGGMLAVALALMPALTSAAWARKSLVCITPTRICKAADDGPIGAPCTCKIHTGWLRGRLG